MIVFETKLTRRAQAAIYDGEETCTKLQSDFRSAGSHRHWPRALLGIIRPLSFCSFEFFGFGDTERNSLPVRSALQERTQG